MPEPRAPHPRSGPPTSAGPTAPIGEVYLRLINQVNAVILSGGPLDGVLDRVTDVIREVVEVERVSILLLDPVTGHLRVRAARGIPRSEWASIAIGLGEGIAGRVAAEGLPLMARDIAATDLPARGGARYRDNSFVSVPLAFQGRIRGVLNLNNRTDGRPLDENDLQLALAVAAMVTLAIENADLLATSLTLQRHFRNVLSHMVIGVIVADRLLSVTLCNAVAARIIGLPPDQTVGRDLESILPPELARAVRTMIAESRRLGTHSERELELPAVAGAGSTPVRAVATVLRDTAGEPDTNVLLLEDVSLRREVAELRRLDELKSNFMAMVSHELRTPLTSLKGAIHLLESGAVDGQPDMRRSLLGLMRRNTDRLILQINNILDVNQIEHGTLSIFPQRVDLAEVLRRAVEVVAPQFEHKGITVDIRLPDTLPVEGDQDRLLQIFCHLLDNAHKFTPARGQVHVVAEVEGDAVAVHVRDTGIGVDPLLRDKVFAKFFQLEHTLTRQAGGSGLGLFLAKGLVDLHGGTIRFCPVAGPGADVEVRLPLAPPVEERAAEIPEEATDG